MNAFVTGNAARDGRDHGDWFVGHMLGPEAGPRSRRDVEIKWATIPAGEPRKAWVKNAEATTLSILIRGRFRLRFPEGEVVLEREGDYALWPPGLPHHWVAEADSIVVTVRWPSRPGDGIEVPPP
jgi:quercetin dioxygenase-like cupin family protein